MIRLNLTEKPAELTAEKQVELTTQFMEDNSVVWNKEYIRTNVLAMSFSKCCFSEIFLSQKSTYLEIEHFYPKNIYPERVVEWGNLIPSCKKCNVTKRNFDTLKEPIVNPFRDNPRDHLYFQKGRLYNKTDVGKRTIEVLALNDREHFVNPRFRQADYIIEQINDFYENHIVDDVILELTPVKLINRINKLKGYLVLGTHKYEFSAYIATEIVDNQYFKIVKDYLQKNNLWDQEFHEIENDLLFCYLGK